MHPQRKKHLLVAVARQPQGLKAAEQRSVICATTDAPAAASCACVLTAVEDRQEALHPASYMLTTYLAEESPQSLGYRGHPLEPGTLNALGQTIEFCASYTLGGSALRAREQASMKAFLVHCKSSASESQAVGTRGPARSCRLGVGMPSIPDMNMEPSSGTVD